MDIIILLLLIIGFTFIAISIARADLACPPPRIIYRYIPKHTLDVQFGNENNPSDIYGRMFAHSSPWIGGYTMGIGKTYTYENE